MDLLHDMSLRLLEAWGHPVAALWSFEEDTTREVRPIEDPEACGEVIADLLRL
jgi:hypothetical protein